MATESQQPSKRLKALVWTARLLVGAVFIISGLAKSIDLWGFVYKINDYLAVWQMPQPHALVVVTAASISMAEFLLGFFLATGSYKRAAPWLLTAMMAVMLPLTVYIAVANPVADCGCFGDFLIISNTATLLKNIVITALLVWLLFYNRRVAGLFHPLSQWIQSTIAVAYILLVGIAGYHIQPLIDFRPFPPGTDLGAIVADASDNTDPDNMIFIYEKNGQSRQFSADNLPDSTWTFIDRIEPQTDGSRQPITIFDSDGDEITADVINEHGTQILLLIPDMDFINIAKTDFISDLCAYITAEPINGSFAAILPADSPNAPEFWTDIALASYPVYTADDTEIKQLARGTMSIVLLRDGIIQWKRSLSSVNSDIMTDRNSDLLDILDPRSQATLTLLSALFLLAELLLFAFDRSSITISHFFARRNKKNT